MKVLNNTNIFKKHKNVPPGFHIFISTAVENDYNKLGVKSQVALWSLSKPKVILENIRVQCRIIGPDKYQLSFDCDVLLLNHQKQLQRRRRGVLRT